MLESISWTQYLAGAATALAIYESAVLFLFYWNDLQKALRSKASPLTGPIAQAGEPYEDTSLVLFEELQGLVRELNTVLEQAGNPAGKEALLAQLRTTLASFAGLRHPAYRTAVFNHIINKAWEINGVRISAEDLADW
ncbi:hypothetical protein VRU48_14915 [Pedobacter sp. KR3-3]|uniref:Uncharacterized protein n=1 Tax=Pedobacter albus TaxID=3113905 RepID=A0ABU7IA98_9SPHI|nr:hypothetical protein [Pedobacter sp. KR3-3]MEE1946413.1 hypothetical protein [Pedobacter sp. KR3-3]